MGRRLKIYRTFAVLEWIGTAKFILYIKWLVYCLVVSGARGHIPFVNGVIFYCLRSEQPLEGCV